MNDVAMSTGLLSLVAVIGLWLGNVEVKKVGLGIGGVLFGGIFVGHFVHHQVSCELKLFLPQLPASEGEATRWMNFETTLLQLRLK